MLVVKEFLSCCSAKCMLCLMNPIPASTNPAKHADIQLKHLCEYMLKKKYKCTIIQLFFSLEIAMSCSIISVTVVKKSF